MAKPAKTAPAAAEGAAKPNSKKKLVLIIVGVLLLAAGGGAAWYFTKGGQHTKEVKAPPSAPPKFLALEPFTVNLQQDGGEQFLQIGITFKFTDPELEEKIKLHMPEIRSHLVFLLSSKRASELVPVEGKKKLVQEIITATSSVLGLRETPAPKIVVYDNNAASDVEAASNVAAASGADATTAEAASAPDETVPAVVHVEKKSTGVLDVLFTSFIIQ